MTLEITCPGSKSMTQRALVIAALRPGTTTIPGALKCDDSHYLTAVLGSLGAQVAWGPNSARVTAPKELVSQGDPVYCGNAGTTVRFGSCLAAITKGRLVLDGDARMRERPIGALGEGLRQLGLIVDYLGEEGFPPISLTQAGPLAKEVTLDLSISSQYASGLLMVAPRLSNGLTLRVAGNIVSRPYLEMTVEMMARAGVLVSRTDAAGIAVPARAYTASEIPVEPDWSTAAFILAAGVLSGREVRIPGLRSAERSLQGDAHFAEICQRVQAAEGDEPRVFDLSDTPDLIAPLAALALFSPARTVIRGVAHARAKECDRIRVLAEQFARLGATVNEREDGMEITPLKHQPRGEWVLEAHNDHRMAMAFGLLSLRVSGVSSTTPECVSKSFPEFWEVLQRFRSAAH